MTTGEHPQLAENDNRGSSRGVLILPPRPGRPNPFGVQWAERVWDPRKEKEVRKRKSEFFPTEELRDRRAAKLRDDKRAGLLRTLNRREIDEWQAFRTATAGTPWQTVVAGWHAYQVSKGLTASVSTVADHAKEYLAEMAKRVLEKTLSNNWHGHQRSKLKLFCARFGTLALNAVPTAEITRWLGSLDLRTPGTYNNYRKIIAAFYASALEARLVAENPVDRVAVKVDVIEEAGILTVPQIAHLMHIARTYTDGDGRHRFAVCVRRLALENFAGVRFGSACRLTKEDVNIEDEGIRHPSRSIKTRKRHYIEGYPAVLWAWLRIAEDDSLLTDRFYLRLKSQLFEVAGVPHPHNCLRHSFATYHLAKRTNPGLTAYLLCHRNQQKLWNTYKGNATKAEGVRWETITPRNAERLARPWAAELARRAGSPA